MLKRGLFECIVVIVLNKNVKTILERVVSCTQAVCLSSKLPHQMFLEVIKKQSVHSIGAMSVTERSHCGSGLCHHLVQKHFLRMKTMSMSNPMIEPLVNSGDGSRIVNPVCCIRHFEAHSDY